jgi:hypothetical protein
MSESSDNDILSSYGGLERNCLLNITNQDEDNNEEGFSEFHNSPYYSTDQFTNITHTLSPSFTVLSLNCQSLNSKYNSIVCFLEHIYASCPNFEFSAICLQETWLDHNDTFSIFQLENYNCISQGKQCCAHGGLVIYLHKRYSYVLKDICPRSEIWEGLFIDILPSPDNKGLTLGNIYKPPKDNSNANLTGFINEISPLLQTLSHDNTTSIITGDFNIDLLKIHNRACYGEFFDTMLTNNFYPTITLPTRLSETSCTLIDNVFLKVIKGNTQQSSGIIISDISDHLPYFASVDISVNTSRGRSYKYIQKQNLSNHALQCFSNELDSLDIINKLDRDPLSDPNINYNILESCLIKAQKQHLPIKNVKFNKYKHKKAKWITLGILRSIRCKDKLYKNLKSSCPGSASFLVNKQKLSAYKTILNRCLRQAKQSYYTTRLHQFKHDSSRTWNILNSIIKRDKKEDSSTQFIINGHETSDTSLIANKFNQYFSNVGLNLASQINIDNNNSYEKYLNSNTESTFEFHLVTEDEVSNTLNNFSPKSSTGYDNISMRVLKSVSPFVVPLLTIIINQSINTGIFPDKLKTAKVIPIFKKNDNKLLENYRPISLLPSVSKIFEKNCI